jgi:hypothetical protein
MFRCNTLFLHNLRAFCRGEVSFDYIENVGNTTYYQDTYIVKRTPHYNEKDNKTAC